MIRSMLADQPCSLILQLGGQLLLGQEGPLCLGDLGRALDTRTTRSHRYLVGSNHETELVTGVNGLSSGQVLAVMRAIHGSITVL